MYDEILVPTDGSAVAEEAVGHAIDIAIKYGARVHALYVVDVNAYSTLEAGTDVVISALEEEGEEAVGKVEEDAKKADIDVVTSVETGTAYRTIIDYIEDNDIDLVVMGTHGRRGVDRYLLGSVTEKVVRTSDAPVLTVRRGKEEAESEEGEE